MNQHNRKDPRAKVLSMTVRYRSATLNEFIEHHSYDVSRGGVFIKTPSPFPPGTLLKFEVKIADDQRVMQGVGRVVWKRDAPGGKDEPTGMGIKFIKLDDASRSVIERLVASRGDDTVSAYDRSPEARAAEMFPTTAQFGSSEDPTVIRPRDEVLAVAPSSESGPTALPSMPVPSGPALSMGTPSGSLLSDPPISMPDSLRQAAPVAPSPDKVSSPPSLSGRPTHRSIPRNPVTSEQPPQDATSRGVLWVTLVALVVGGGLAYVKWLRPAPPAPAPEVVPAAVEAEAPEAVPEVPTDPAAEEVPIDAVAEPSPSPSDPAPEEAVPPLAPPDTPAVEAAPAALPSAPERAPEPTPQPRPQPKPQPKPKPKAKVTTETVAPEPLEVAPSPEAQDAKPEVAPASPASPPATAPAESPPAASEDEFR